MIIDFDAPTHSVVTGYPFAFVSSFVSSATSGTVASTSVPLDRRRRVTAAIQAIAVMRGTVHESD